jgi:hypothetical protein
MIKLNEAIYISSEQRERELFYRIECDASQTPSPSQLNVLERILVVASLAELDSPPKQTQK